MKIGVNGEKEFYKKTGDELLSCWKREIRKLELGNIKDVEEQRDKSMKYRNTFSITNCLIMNRE